MKLALISIAVLFIVLAGAFVALELRAVVLPKLEVPQTATVSETVQRLDAWVAKLQSADKFNGAIVISRGGEVIFERYIGMADETGRPVTADTSFNLASVSKHFTAFAVLLLAHEDKLARDDLLAVHIPELEGLGGLTIDHLLSHTSGLPDYALDRKLAAGLEKADAVFAPSDLIAWLGEPGRELKFTPGERDDYSNTNFVLLAEIVARVSGRPFADFMQQRIFDPMGMRHSAVVNKIVNTDVLADRAYGFRKRFLYFGRNVRHDLNRMDGVAGDGNIYANARDLLTWDRALREGMLLPSEVYQQAYAPIRLNSGALVEEKVFGNTVQPGLGWNVQDFPKVTAYGSWQAFSNFYMRDLRDETVLVVLSNSGVFLRTAMIGERLATIAPALSGK